MRAMIRILMATVIVVASCMFVGVGERTADAQAPNGECFDLVQRGFIGELDEITVEYSQIVRLPGTSTVQTVLEVVPCPGDTDEVLGITTTPDEVLAFTGGEVNTTVAIGASMIAAGGLAVYAARRREQGERASLAERIDESISA